MTDVYWFNFHLVAFLDTAHVRPLQIRFCNSENTKSTNYEVSLSFPLSWDPSFLFNPFFKTFGSVKHTCLEKVVKSFLTRCNASTIQMFAFAKAKASYTYKPYLPGTYNKSVQGEWQWLTCSIAHQFMLKTSRKLFCTVLCDKIM
jgi:hypothetical protein